jgi:excisionase family DNA binding protein
MSLTLRDIELAQDVVEDLVARGAQDQAAAIERLISTAASTLGTGPKEGPRELLTTGQAARALGVSVQTIKNWANAGQLQAVRLGGRVMVHREALMTYLDAVRRSRPAPVNQLEPEPHATFNEREFVYAGFPPEKTERVRALSDLIEAGESLSDDEETELAQLEAEIGQISRDRLKVWISQRRKDRKPSSSVDNGGHGGEGAQR